MNSLDNFLFCSSVVRTLNLHIQIIDKSIFGVSYVS